MIEYVAVGLIVFIGALFAAFAGYSLKENDKFGYTLFKLFFISSLVINTVGAVLAFQN